ncbi:hypothetical protein JCM10296v2_005257 [Rhodotorula toruloides]
MSGQSSFNRAKFATQSWQVISTLVSLTPLAPIPCAIYGGRWMAIIDLLLVVIAIMGIRSSYIDFNVANASLNSIKASLANMNTQFWVSVTVPYCLFVGFAVWVIWDSSLLTLRDALSANAGAATCRAAAEEGWAAPLAAAAVATATIKA